MLLLLLSQVTSGQTVESDSSSIITEIVVVQDSLRLPEPIDIRFRGYYEGNKKLKTKDILARLSKGNLTVFSMYQKGRKEQKVGGYLTIIGSGIYSVGGVLAFRKAVGEIFSNGDTEVNYTAENVLMIAGGAVIAGGISKVVIGKTRTKRDIRKYNEVIEARKQTALFYVKPGLSGASIGLTF